MVMVLGGVFGNTADVSIAHTHAIYLSAIPGYGCL